VLEPARLENPGALIDALASADSRAWDDALAREAPALRGKVFSAEDFGALRARLHDSQRRARARDWVAFAERLGPFLDAEQSIQLASLAWTEMARADEAALK
jgi:hypothetical protein